MFEFLCDDLQHASDSNEGHSHSFIWTTKKIKKTSNTFKRYLHCMDITCSLNVLFDLSQYVSYLRVSKNQDLKQESHVFSILKSLSNVSRTMWRMRYEKEYALSASLILKALKKRSISYKTLFRLKRNPNKPSSTKTHKEKCFFQKLYVRLLVYI